MREEVEAGSFSHTQWMTEVAAFLQHIEQVVGACCQPRFHSDLVKLLRSYHAARGATEFLCEPELGRSPVIYNHVGSLVFSEESVFAKVGGQPIENKMDGWERQRLINERRRRTEEKIKAERKAIKAAAATLRAATRVIVNPPPPQQQEEVELLPVPEVHELPLNNNGVLHASPFTHDPIDSLRERAGDESASARAEFARLFGNINEPS